MELSGKRLTKIVAIVLGFLGLIGVCIMNVFMLVYASPAYLRIPRGFNIPLYADVNRGGWRRYFVLNPSVVCENLGPLFFGIIGFLGQLKYFKTNVGMIYKNFALFSGFYLFLALFCSLGYIGLFGIIIGTLNLFISLFGILCFLFVGGDAYIYDNTERENDIQEYVRTME